MRSPTYSIIVGLLWAVFLDHLHIISSSRSSGEIEGFSEYKVGKTVEAVVDSTFPIAASIALAWGLPWGPVIASGICLSYAAFSVIRSFDPDVDLSLYLEEVEEAMKESERIDFQYCMSERIIDELTYKIESHGVLRDMRVDLLSFQALHSNSIRCLKNPDCEKTIKDGIFNELLSPVSVHRQRLNSFVFKYIKTKSDDLQIIEKSFFDFILEKQKLEEADNNNCHSQSLHMEIWNAFMFITSVLTNSYSVVQAAYAIHHEEMKDSKPLEAEYLVKEMQVVIAEFLGHMEDIMSEAEKALEQSSTAFCMSNPTKFIPGKTFGFLNFIKIRYSHFNSPEQRDSLYPRFTSRLREKIILWPGRDRTDLFNTQIHINKFGMFNCKEMDAGKYIFYIDKTDKEQPLDRLDEFSGTPFFGEHTLSGTYGRERKLIRPYRQIELYSGNSFPISKCDAYEIGRIKFSMKPIFAQRGYVVTGIRWRIRKDTIYIDIQEGKFIDVNRVDVGTLEWKSTPEDDDNTMVLSNDLKSVVLEDIKLPENYCVTGIQMIPINGKIVLTMSGLAINEGRFLDETAKQFAFSNVAENTEELMLNGTDDPMMAPENSMTRVMNVQGKYHVKFQPTDFEKDLGRTTIPYFDLQEVVTNPPTPINGVGIYYKGVSGYGGFLGLKMMSLNHTQMINMYRREFENLSASLTSHKLGL